MGNEARKLINEMQFSKEYKESIYAVWYAASRPRANKIADKLPPDETGRYVKATTVDKWIKDEGWNSRADATDIEVQKQTDRKLVEMRMDMMKRHAKQARDIADDAFKFLHEEGFDSSASAVTAWVKAVEEEKKSTGMQIALTEVFSLSDDDLKKKLDQLMNRLTNVGEVTITKGGEVIEGETEEVGEENAISTEEGTI
jgi:hypothetical protein